MALTDDERSALDRLRGMPVAVTPYYASLLRSGGASHPLRRSVIPTCAEFLTSRGEADDPLGEDDMSPVPGLVHRYPDRVLFLATGKCSVNCRYCTRSRVVAHGHLKPDRERWDRAIAYVASRPEVRDVLISGGDPLTMSNHRLEYLLSRLRRVKHVEVIRIGTKAPVVLPQRVTARLARMLKRFHPLWFSIHFTHPHEITHEVAQACGALADVGIPLGSQTVLLKGINDDIDTMRDLMQGLMRIRVRPYYLYQCDPITGSAHFRTPLTTGVGIIRQLRGHTTGYAVPTYVIDAPGGGGKIPIGPQYVTGYEEGSVVMRNYQGNEYRYPDAPE
jgi:lysine 2,3-aminomutase